jgi:hypothetical protein
MAREDCDPGPDWRRLRFAGRSCSWTSSAAAASVGLVRRHGRVDGGGCSGSGDHGPSSPQAAARAAAQAWADAGLHHDRPARRALSCAAGSSGEGMLGLLTYATRAYKAGPAQPDGPLSWMVPVQAIKLDGDKVGLTFHVVREHDRYLVC